MIGSAAKPGTGKLLDSSTEGSGAHRPTTAWVLPLGERRQLLLALMILVGLVYAPRLSRLETYLLVATKRALTLAPAGLPWRASLERSLYLLEERMEWPSKRLQLVSTSVAVRINQSLEAMHCPPAMVSRLVRAKALNPELVLSADLKRICQAPIRREAERQLQQSGLTADGKVLLQAGDRVFIAGDSLMQGPATQLAPRFRARGLQPMDASRVSTGLAYPQFFDWVGKIKSAISQGRVDVVIVFLGANDTFDMYEGPQRIAIGTPAWEHLYAGRIEQIASFAKQHNVPLIWLGMPAMNRSDIQPYVPAMNRLYASVVRRHGGVFVPTDRVLGETDQCYTPVKVIHGKRLMVRSDDGVHFTPTGWSLVADAVIRQVRFQ